MQSEPGRFHQIPGLAAPGVWRPLVGVVLLVVLVFGGQLVLTTVAGLILVLGGLDASTALDRLAGDPVTPIFLAVVNLGWALAIPAVFLVLFALHRLSPGWAASVAGRMRWRWMLACFGIALAALTATVLVSTFLPNQGDASVEISGSANQWSAQTRDFVLVVLLLTPLQAAGEEYAFRGYLTQATGGLLSPLGNKVAMAGAVVVPAFLFACAHGLGQDVPIFFDRFAFGLVAGTLVLITGGLEAGIAMHVLNNFLAFGLALAFGDMTEALTPTDGSWWSIPVTLTQSLTYLGGCWWMARRMGVADRGRVPVLERSVARV
ncbi:CPBP family intramembrane metalloprotease [Nocardioides sp. BGMRC 2183]|nr:CPBP family intramembrane metalloprotease [Nocardioides sp. BGMRC 2183]